MEYMQSKYNAFKAPEKQNDKFYKKLPNSEIDIDIYKHKDLTLYLISLLYKSDLSAIYNAQNDQSGKHFVIKQIERFQGKGKDNIAYEHEKNIYNKIKKKETQKQKEKEEQEPKQKEKEKENLSISKYIDFNVDFDDTYRLIIMPMAECNLFQFSLVEHQQYLVKNVPNYQNLPPQELFKYNYLKQKHLKNFPLKILNLILNGYYSLEQINLIYSDLKPQNILVKACQHQNGKTEHELKLCDLGGTTRKNNSPYPFLYGYVQTNEFYKTSLANDRYPKNIKEMYSESDILEDTQFAIKKLLLVITYPYIFQIQILEEIQFEEFKEENIDKSLQFFKNDPDFDLDLSLILSSEYQQQQNSIFGDSLQKFNTYLKKKRIDQDSLQYFDDSNNSIPTIKRKDIEQQIAVQFNGQTIPRKNIPFFYQEALKYKELNCKLEEEAILLELLYNIQKNNQNLDPNNTYQQQILFDLGQFYQNQNQNKQAIIYYQQLKQLNNSSPHQPPFQNDQYQYDLLFIKGLINQGIISLQAQKDQEAQNYFLNSRDQANQKKLLDADPIFPIIYIYLAITYQNSNKTISKGCFKKCKNLLQKYKIPITVELAINLSQYHLKKKDKSKALKTLKKFIKDPENLKQKGVAKIYLDLASVYSERKNSSQNRIDCLKKVLQLVEKEKHFYHESEALLQLTQVYKEIDNFTESLKYEEIYLNKVKAEYNKRKIFFLLQNIFIKIKNSLKTKLAKKDHYKDSIIYLLQNFQDILEEPLQNSNISYQEQKYEQIYFIISAPCMKFYSDYAELSNLYPILLDRFTDLFQIKIKNPKTEEINKINTHLQFTLKILKILHPNSAIPDSEFNKQFNYRFYNPLIQTLQEEQVRLGAETAQERNDILLKILLFLIETLFETTYEDSINKRPIPNLVRLFQQKILEQLSDQKQIKTSLQYIENLIQKTENKDPKITKTTEDIEFMIKIFIQQGDKFIKTTKEISKIYYEEAQSLLPTKYDQSIALKLAQCYLLVDEIQNSISLYKKYVIYLYNTFKRNNFDAYEFHLEQLIQNILENQIDTLPPSFQVFIIQLIEKLYRYAPNPQTYYNNMEKLSQQSLYALQQDYQDNLNMVFSKFLTLLDDFLDQNFQTKSQAFHYVIQKSVSIYDNLSSDHHKITFAMIKQSLLKEILFQKSQSYQKLQKTDQIFKCLQLQSDNFGKFGVDCIEYICKLIELLINPTNQNQSLAIEQQQYQEQNIPLQEQCKQIYSNLGFKYLNINSIKIALNYFQKFININQNPQENYYLSLLKSFTSELQKQHQQQQALSSSELQINHSYQLVLLKISELLFHKQKRENIQQLNFDIQDQSQQLIQIELNESEEQQINDILTKIIENINNTSNTTLNGNLYHYPQYQQQYQYQNQYQQQQEYYPKGNKIFNLVIFLDLIYYLSNQNEKEKSLISLQNKLNPLSSQYFKSQQIQIYICLALFYMRENLIQNAIYCYQLALQQCFQGNEYILQLVCQNNLIYLNYYLQRNVGQAEINHLKEYMNNPEYTEHFPVFSYNIQFLDQYQLRSIETENSNEEFERILEKSSTKQQSFQEAMKDNEEQYQYFEKNIQIYNQIVLQELEKEQNNNNRYHSNQIFRVDLEWIKYNVDIYQFNYI